MKTALAIAVFALFPTAAAWSQSAELSGSVTDPAGSAVAGAQVTALNRETGVSREIRSNEAGVYTFPALEPGEYDLNASAKGFRKFSRVALRLEVAGRVRVDVSLQVGALEDQVTVAGEAPLINSNDGTVSTVVDREFVENLPMNGRTFQSLIALTPGVVLTPASYGSMGQFSVNGQRSDSNYFMIDGVSANFGAAAGGTFVQTASGALPALSSTGGTNGLVSIDAMQEFRVQTSTFAAEYGRAPGGQISIATRSGTNQLHGTAFEYLRNEALDANDWFSNRSGLKKTPERQNDYGGVLGGAIVKNATFYFLSYEGLSLEQPVVTTTLVPTVAARQTAPAGVQPFLKAYPLPNGADQGNGFAGFTAGYSNPSSIQAGSVRIDQRFTDKLIAFFRFNESPSRTTQRSYSLSTLTGSPFDVRTITGGATFILSPSIVNEGRLNFSRNHAGLVYTQDNFGGATPLTPESVFPSSVDPQKSVLEFLLLNGTTSYLFLGPQNDNASRQWNIIDNLSITRGAHQLKIGYDYRHMSMTRNELNYLAYDSFSTLQQALTGVINTAEVLSYVPTVAFAFFNSSVYAQDTWKIHPKLTITYGLRWDVNPAPHGIGSTISYGVRNFDNPANTTLAPPNAPVYSTDWAAIAPRLGIAWQPRNGIVMRGGFGLFYDAGTGIADQSIGALGTYGLNLFSNVPFPLTAAQAAPPAIAVVPPYSFTGGADNVRPPYTAQWSFAVEKSIGHAQALTVSYIGNEGHRLLREEYFIKPNALFSSLYLTLNASYSRYNALQTEFRRNLTHGLQALATYTWAHSLDNASSDGGGFLPGQVLNRNLDYGSSDYDVSHTFTAATTWNIPHVPGNAWLTRVTNGWGLDFDVIAHSAFPFTPSSGTQTIGPYSYTLRPDYILGQPLYTTDSSVPGGRRWNRNAFTVISGRQGTAGRNILRGFPMSQANLALRREFHLTERLRLQFRAEAFNFINHPNFGAPNTTVTSTLFGVSTGTLSLGTGGLAGGLSPIYSVAAPRSVQLAAKFVF